MRVLKGLALFAVGSGTMLLAVAAAFVYRTENPDEDAVVYEDDSLKVIRLTEPDPDKHNDYAAIVYKNR